MMLYVFGLLLAVIPEPLIVNMRAASRYFNYQSGVEITLVEPIPVVACPPPPPPPVPASPIPSVWRLTIELRKEP